MSNEDLIDITTVEILKVFHPPNPDSPLLTTTSVCQCPRRGRHPYSPRNQESVELEKQTIDRIVTPIIITL